ncbi:hypothetical protein GCM10027517_15180 [Phycicoccus ginsengisoli]
MSRTRRYPNFVAFIATGAIVGFVIGSAVAWFTPENTTPYGNSYGSGTAVMFLGVGGAFLFGLLAAVVAVLLDRGD